MSRSRSIASSPVCVVALSAATVFGTGIAARSAPIANGDTFTYTTRHSYWIRNPNAGPAEATYTDTQRVVYPVAYGGRSVYALHDDVVQTSFHPLATAFASALLSTPGFDLTTTSDYTYFDVLPNGSSFAAIEYGYALEGSFAYNTSTGIETQAQTYSAPYHFIGQYPERPGAPVASNAGFVGTTKTGITQSPPGATFDQRTVRADGSYMDENWSRGQFGQSHVRVVLRADASNFIEHEAAGQPTHTIVTSAPDPAQNVIRFTDNDVPGAYTDWITPAEAILPARTLMSVTNTVVGSRRMPFNCKQYTGMPATLDVETVYVVDPIAQMTTALESKYYDVPAMGTVCLVEDSVRQEFFYGTSATTQYDRTASVLTSETISPSHAGNVLPMHVQSAFARNLLATM